MADEKLEKELETLRRQTVSPKPLVYALLEGLVDQRSCSQASQDLFVLEMLESKNNGTYLEIGGGHFSESNNTFILEKEFGWNGISIEIDKELVNLFNDKRRNKAIASDATSFDYRTALKESSFASQIDFLSLDIDPAPVTFKALEKLPHDDFRFSVITYEHDRYLSGDEWMIRSRSLLSELGYHLVVKNLKCFGRDIEDWWIDPNVVKEEIHTRFNSSDIEFSTLWLNYLKLNQRSA
jgi:hypothetical protein